MIMYTITTNVLSIPLTNLINTPCHTTHRRRSPHPRDAPRTHGRAGGAGRGPAHLRAAAGGLAGCGARARGGVQRAHRADPRAEGTLHLHGMVMSS